MPSRILLALLAISALVLGVLVYRYDRSLQLISFLTDDLSQTTDSIPRFGWLAEHLPSFLHVYAFIILTALVAVPSLTRLIPVCVAWAALEGLFEIAQIKVIGLWLAAHTPQQLLHIPLLSNTAAYFRSGTFDPVDLLFILIGTFAAYYTVRFTQGGLDYAQDR